MSQSQDALGQKSNGNSIRDEELLSKLEVLEANHLAQLRSLKVGGKSSLFNELAAIFTKEAPSRMASLRKAFEIGDMPELARIAHASVGSLASLGARQMQVAMRALEHAAKEGNQVECMRCLVAVEGAWTRLQEGLAEAVKEKAS
jgi:HPt (histidine-containing phosphotransfer) domain-containing protein